MAKAMIYGSGGGEEAALESYVCMIEHYESGSDEYESEVMTTVPQKRSFDIDILSFGNYVRLFYPDGSPAYTEFRQNTITYTAKASGNLSLYTGYSRSFGCDFFRDVVIDNKTVTKHINAGQTVKCWWSNYHNVTGTAYGLFTFIPD